MQDPLTGAYYSDGTKSELTFVPGSITEFLIEETVERIKGGSRETAAFRECRNLKVLSFSRDCKLRTLESYACWKLSVDVLDLRNCTYLTDISVGAFTRSSFSELYLPPNLVSIQTAAFSYCSNLLHVDFPDSLTRIGGYSQDGSPFMRCTKLSINFTENSRIESLGSVAFGYSQVPDIYIPQNLTSLGNKVYAGTMSRTITVHPQNKMYKAGKDCLLSKDGKTLIFALSPLTGTFVVPDNVTSTADGAFAESKYSAIEFPSTIKKLGSQIFSYMKSLSSFSMSDTINELGVDIFESCSSLQSVTLSKSITAITARMFLFCTSLNRVEIPKGCKSIGERAFYGCSNLTYTFVPNTVTKIYSACFAQTHPNLEIKFENDSIFSIKNQVLYNSDGSELIQYIGEAAENFKFIVNSNVEKILQSSFEGIKLDDIEFDCSANRLKFIGKKAFCGCNLRNVTLPSSIEAIEESAFESCLELNIVVFKETPSDYLNISKRTFALSGLLSFKIPQNVSVIFEESFIGCKNLKIIDFDSNSNLKQICKSSFSNTGVESLTLPSSLETVGIETFSGSNIKWVLFDCHDLTEIPVGCFRNCKSLKSITLGGSIFYIRSESFQECSYLESITIGERVSIIESKSFSNCKKLESILFSDRSNISSIYASAFSGCSSLKTLIVPISNSQLSTEDDILFDKDQTNIIFSLPNRNNKNLIIPSTVETISSGAFEECLSLFSVSVEKSLICESEHNEFNLRTIGFQAFLNCESLNYFFIPPSVTSIGSNAFMGSGLKECGSVEYPLALHDKLLEVHIPEAALAPCPSNQFTANIENESIPMGAIYTLFEGD